MRRATLRPTFIDRASNGKIGSGTSDRQQNVDHRASGEVIGHLALADKDGAHRAVAAACAPFTLLVTR
jgi:acyl-CoA reductase-like NAD-dependent aldehyde dehydrogenase